MVFKKAVLSALAILGTITLVSALSPAPAPAPFQPVTTTYHSVPSIVILFSSIIIGVMLVAFILLVITSYIKEREEKIQERKRADRRAIANFDKDLAFIDLYA